MPLVLLIYSTTDGQTKKISQYLKGVIEESGSQVILRSIQEDLEEELSTADKIVLGASIRYGKHSRDVYAFVKKFQLILDSKPNAFFSVNMVARKPGKNTPETNPYLKKFLKQIDWKPKQLTVFAGKINYPLYNFFDTQIIRLIMWITNGPTDPEAVVEFTDWNQVDEFGKLIGQMTAE